MYNNPSDYVMVGGEYYRKCRTPYDMSSDKVELVPWPRSQINEDFRQCPEKKREIERYDGFCNIPEHLNYRQFSYEDSTAGSECVVVGTTEFSEGHRAVHILPNGRVFSTDSSSVKDVKTARMHPYPQIWTYRGTIDDLYLQIQIERMINAKLVTPIHFTGFEKVETSHGPEYLFYGSNCINYYRDVHENVISSYYKNIPDIKTCHDRIGDRIWKREITVTEVKGAKESRSQGNGMKKG